MRQFVTILAVVQCLLLFGQKSLLLESIRQQSEKGKKFQDEGNYAVAEQYLQGACLSTDSLIAFLKDSSAWVRKRAGLKRKSMRSPKYPYFNSFDDLAALYTMSGNYEKAENTYNTSIQKRAGYFEKKSAHRIKPHIGLGKLYYAKGDLEKATAQFALAGQMLRSASTTGFNYDALANEIYRYECELYLREGKARQAWKSLDRYFVSLNTTNFSREQAAEAFDLKARYYMAIGDFDNAEFFLKKAKREVFGYSSNVYSPASLKILKTKAILDWSRNFTDSTIRDFKTLITQYVDNIRKNFAAMSEAEREQFFVTLRQDFDLFNAFTLQHLDNQELLNLAYNNQLFTKALLLNEINKRRSAIRSSGNPQLQSAYNEWEKAKQELAALYFRSKKGVADAAMREDRINELEKEINKQMGSVVDETQPEWATLLARLEPREAAIEVIRVNPVRFQKQAGAIRQHVSDSSVYLALVLSKEKNGPRGFIISNGALLETRMVHYFRNAIRNQLRDTLSYQNFWSPFKQYLLNVDRIYFSADGVFNQINLNAMQNPVTGQFVVDEVNLVIVTNTKDILLSKSDLGRSASFYGNPKFSSDLSVQVNLTSNESRATRSFLSRELLDLDAEAIPELPGTETEVSAIEKLLQSNGWSVDVNMGSEATEENLKSVKSPAILHIATHGFFLTGGRESANAMIRSGILLAGVKGKRNGQSEDGVLTAYEATTLNLNNTGLVVLSACETGLGELKNGEGVYGLQRGFQVAGAKNLLMSLWKVDDTATSMLMQEFYQSWAGGLPIHDAFRQAQVSLRKQYSHPYYWGAFILLGK